MKMLSADVIDDLVEESMAGDYPAVCTECGAVTYGLEPDAEGAKCEECGHFSVMGFENYILRYC